MPDIMAHWLMNRNRIVKLQDNPQIVVKFDWNVRKGGLVCPLCLRTMMPPKETAQMCAIALSFIQEQLS